MTTRLHVSRSDKLARVIDKREYRNQRVSDKPVGFWWGVGNAWMKWCETEQWRVGGHVYMLDIDDTRLCRISGYKKFDAFHERFRAPLYSSGGQYYINWPAVAEEWDGIEIAPYLWQRRLGHETRWYYGWDCASGVTWRPRKVIRGIEYVKEWSA